MGDKTCSLGEQVHGILSYLTTRSCRFLSSRISVTLSVDDNQHEWRSCARNWQITTAKFVGDLTHGSVLDIHLLQIQTVFLQQVQQPSFSRARRYLPLHSNSFVKHTAHWKQFKLQAVTPLVIQAQYTRALRTYVTLFW